MTSKRRVLFFMPSLFIIGASLVAILRIAGAERGQDSQVVLKPRAVAAAPAPAAETAPVAMPAVAAQPASAAPAAPRSATEEQSVYISVFPTDPVSEPANMAEAEERMYPSAPAPGSLGAAVRAYEQSPQYAASAKPLDVSISLDEALQAARSGQTPGGNSSDVLFNPFGAAAK